MKKGILLKISGEYFSSDTAIFDYQKTSQIAHKLRAFIRATDHPTYVVLGGGNICRGRELTAFNFMNGDADRIGMLSTLQNALLLKLMLDTLEMKTHVMAPFSAEYLEIHAYDPGKARWWAEKQKHIVIFGSGLGICGFSTDMTAVSRAYETGCDMVVKFTNVGGLYTADPKLHASAELIPKISFDDVLRKNLSVMDQVAFQFAKEKNITIKILDLFHEQSHMIKGTEVGSLVC